MDKVIDDCCIRTGNGEVVVLYWVSRNNPLMGVLVVDWWYYYPKRAKAPLTTMTSNTLRIKI